MTKAGLSFPILNLKFDILNFHPAVPNIDFL